MRSWIWRSLKKVLVRRLVCDGALSSCRHKLDVSAPCNVADTLLPAFECGTLVDGRGAHRGAWVPETKGLRHQDDDDGDFSRNFKFC